MSELRGRRFAIREKSSSTTIARAPPCSYVERISPPARRARWVKALASALRGRRCAYPRGGPHVAPARERFTPVCDGVP
jgi:hypothetical protein